MAIRIPKMPPKAVKPNKKALWIGLGIGIVTLLIPCLLPWVFGSTNVVLDNKPFFNNALFLPTNPTLIPLYIILFSLTLISSYNRYFHAFPFNVWLHHNFTLLSLLDSPQSCFLVYPSPLLLLSFDLGGP